MPTVKETFDAMASRFQPSKATGITQHSKCRRNSGAIGEQG